MKLLTRSDEMLLLTVYRLGENAYGVSIIKDIYERTGKELKIGSLWVSLDNLVKRGYLEKAITDPTPVRGGKSKMNYQITSAGKRALAQTRQVNDVLWHGLRENIDLKA